MRTKADYTITRLFYTETVVREFPSEAEDALMEFLRTEKHNERTVKITVEPKLGKLYNSWVVTTERIKH